MPGIDECLLFQPLSIGVLSIGDAGFLDKNAAGSILEAEVSSAGHKLSSQAVIKNDGKVISDQIKRWARGGDLDVILTMGGTGLSETDVAIEVISPLFEKRLDGFSRVFHQLNLKSIGVSTLHFRARAGLIDGVLVFCLPGSPHIVRLVWNELLRDALDSRYRPASLVDLFPRLLE